MEEFINFYKEKNKTKSISTIKTFKTTVRRLEKYLRLKFDEWTPNTFNNYNLILDGLLNDFSLSTVILTILIIIRYLEFKGNKKNIGNYREILNELVKERNKSEYEQIKTRKEKDNWIKYEELKEIIEEKSKSFLSAKKAFTKFRNFLILSLYTLQPPTRIGNYLNMKIKFNLKKKGISSLSKKYNYITKEGNNYKMVFNNYKTSKYLGKIIHTIENNILNKLIDKWLTEYNKTSWFMVNKSGKPITQTNFTHAQKSISRTIFKKELSTNDFRHIYLKWFLSKNPSVNEKIKLGQLIGQKYKPSRMELYDKRYEESE